MKRNKRISVQPNKLKQCDLCQEQYSQNNLNTNFNQKLLKRKFYNPHIQSYYFRNLNDILFDPYSKNYVQFQEMSHLSYQSQTLTQNYDFQSICHSIKKIVLKRVQKDSYGFIDFKDEHYKLTLGYHLRKKQFNKNKRRSKNIYKSTLSTQQTAEDKNLLELLQSKDKIAQKNFSDVQLDLVSNISEIQLRKLAKKLDIMADSALGKKYKMTPKLYNSGSNLLLSPRKKINEKELFFKKKLQKQISVITKNQSDRIVAQKQVQIKADNYLQFEVIKQSYGLQTFKKEAKKRSKRILKSSQKLGIEKYIPMTPKPRFYHGTCQYDQRYRQVEYKQITSPKAKKNNTCSTPLSPGNNKSLQNKSKLSSSKKSSLSSKKQKETKIKTKSNSSSKKFI